jgi:hypothetical protein
MNLSKLLLITAIFTFAAGVVLIVAPNAIPGAIGIHLDRSAYLVCYLLGASELSLAVLCYCGGTLTDPGALRVVAATCLVFHASSAAVEIYAFTQGASAAVWGNVAIRALFAILLGYYAFYKTPLAGSPA